MSNDTTLVKLARQLRKDQTPWEKKLWKYLKGSQFYGCKFKRQMAIGKYIYDFSCFEKKLIIELDGAEHTEPEVIAKDRIKQKFAENLGYKVLRFPNSDIDNNLAGVLEKIRLILN